MSAGVTAGAYVIRNKGTSSVLHAQNPCGDHNLLAHAQDERAHFSEQIWWIEPLPDYEDDHGVVYSITNPASRKALDMNAFSGHVQWGSRTMDRFVV